jgi:hypothetical protein
MKKTLLIIEKMFIHNFKLKEIQAQNIQVNFYFYHFSKRNSRKKQKKIRNVWKIKDVHSKSSLR